MSKDRLIDEDLQKLYEVNGVKWKEGQRRSIAYIQVNMPSLEERPCPEVVCQRCGFSAIVGLENKNYSYSDVNIRFRNLRTFNISGCPVKAEFYERFGDKSVYNEFGLASDILDSIPSEGCLVQKQDLGLDQGKIVRETLVCVNGKLQGIIS